MSWARIDDGFFRHPKARAAGRDGRALFMAGLCWSAGHLTDGFIASADLGLVAAEAEVRPKATVGRLVDIGLWEAVDGGWRIHDYHDYNPGAEAEREKRRKRAEAGRKGGLKSRPPGSKPEANVEANASANGQAKQEQIRTPSPYPSEELTSSDTSPGAPDKPDDDQPTRDERQRAGTAVAVLAQRDLDALPPDHRAGVADPEAWRRTAHQRRDTAHGQALLTLAHQHPDATPDQLADLVSPPSPTRRGRPNDVDPEHQLADRARHERDQALHAQALEVPVHPDAAGRLRAIRDATHLHAVPGQAS